MHLRILVTLQLAALASAQEYRGAWIARDGLTSRGKIIASLDAVAQANMNLVCVDVWTRGYSVHPSDVLQRVGGARQDPTYVGRDPLQEMITEAHRRGIEVEAWLEYGFIAGWSGWFTGSGGRGPVLNQNPAWTAVDVAGNNRFSDGMGGFYYWMSAAHPQVQAFLIDLATELVDRYDIDGIQFDRVRYPSTDFGYDPATVAAYRATHGNNPPPSNPNDAGWMRWRADQLNVFAAQIFAKVKAHRSSVRVTNAPISMSSAYNNFLQDWPQWLNAGALDAVYPQIYSTTAAGYVATLDANLGLFNAQRRSKIAPGLRAISGTPTTELLAMVAANRARNLAGQVFWYLEGLYDDLPSLQSAYFTTSVPCPGHTAAWRPAPVVLQENDASTTRSAGWTAFANAGASGGSLVSAQAAGSERIEFRFSPAVAGLYSLQASQVVFANATRAAPHRVLHAGGEQIVRVNQSDPLRTGFFDLGTFWLEAGTDRGIVTVSNDRIGTGAVVYADAIEWLPSRQRGGPFSTYGAGTAGAGGVVPRLSLSGPCTPAGRITMQVNAAPAASAAMVLLGAGRTNIPFAGGFLLTLPLVSLLQVADQNGEGTAPLDVPFDVGLRGVIVDFQAVVLDPAGQDGVTLTAGVEARIE